MHEAQVWFVIAVPVLCLLAIGFDRMFAPRRGRFVARAPWDPRAATSRTVSTRSRTVGTRAADTQAADVHAAGIQTVAEPAGAATVSPGAAPRVTALYDAALEDPDPSDRAPAPRPDAPAWRPGLPLRAPSADGHPPAEATVRKRAWMAYATIASAEEIGAANMARLERGRPPVRFNPLNSMLEAQQISVDENGRSAIRWFDSDESIDPFAVSDHRRGG